MKTYMYIYIYNVILCIRKGSTKMFVLIHILFRKETLEECLPKVGRREWGR